MLYKLLDARMDRVSSSEEERQMSSRLLLHAGRRYDVNSIFIGIQREKLPSREAFELSLSQKDLLTIPVRFIGYWESLNFYVQEITLYPEGMLVVIKPSAWGSLLRNWSDALLWVPNEGGAGVLA